MIRAVYVRTLRPGITDDEFVAAWLPPHHTRDSYPARVAVGRSATTPDQVISVFDIEVALADFEATLPDLIHPDSEARLQAIVESTQLADVYEVSTTFGQHHDKPERSMP